jgi:hypothetical protein
MNSTRIRIAILIVTILLIIVIGYVIMSGRTEQKKQTRQTYASIVMPDGSIISGECTGYDRIDRYVTVYMTDKVYKVSDWRVAIWYERKKEEKKK